MTSPPAGTTPAASVTVNVTLNAGTPRVERQPITVRLTQVTGSAITAPRAGSPVEPIALPDLAADTGANCFLQIWEMDEYRADRYLTNEETDRQAVGGNALVASIPGILVRRARGQYEFQLPQNFARPAFDREQASANGFVRLRLRDAGDEFRILNLHMPQYEKFFELGATIRTVADDTSYAGVNNQPPFQVRNEIASIRQQMRQRGGITFSISGNWRTGTAANGNPTMTNNNDAEFERQAEGTLSVLPSFMPDDARSVKIGYHLFEQNTDATLAELAGMVRETRLAAGKGLAENDAFLDAAAQGREEANITVVPPALEQCPRVATLLVFCHGFRSGLTNAGVAANTHLRTTRTSNIATWVPTITPHCVGNLNVALYACNCGRGLFVGAMDSHADATMGKKFPAEELGLDSYAWTLFRTLRENGLAQPSVWGHTTAAHTTRNPFLRVFCSAGSADMVCIVKQTPRTDNFRSFINVFSTGEGWVHRGNFLREVCTYHGAYLDWAWNGGQTLGPATAWFDASVANEVALLMQETREVADAAAPTLPEEVLFEDATRRVIIAPNGAAFAAGVTPDPLLTRLLRLSHFPLSTTPFRLSAALVGGIQLVCDRVKANATTPIATIVEVRDDGESAIIRGTTTAFRSQLVVKASAAVTQGFLQSSMTLPDNDLLVSVRVGGATTISR